MHKNFLYMNNPLDARQLRAFLMLAEHGSFTLAAREMHQSQPAVSQAVKLLEAEVGCRLLDRVGKKVLLTQAGEQFVGRAKKIFSEMADARAEMDELSEWGRGRLRIGASAAACQYILPPVLREFQKQFPKCRLSIEPGDTAEIVEALRENLIDIAVTLEPRHDPDFEFKPLFTDELVFLVNPKHPWAEAGRALRKDIARQQYILYFRNSRTFEFIEDYLRAEGISIKSVIETGSMSAIKELVKLGLGITILAPWIAREELAKKQLIALPLGRRKLKRQWGLLYWKGRPMGWAEETFVKLCRSGAAQFAAGNGLRSHV
ncbi:MAG: LysR family transcriptional regulator [Verrucomicrobia subdivision 3 bacterium]|nr:LysR family transcriptional regulator [Limisphaerales bacterium]